MDRIAHSLTSVGMSALAGVLFAFISAIPDRSVYPLLLLVLIVGAAVGLALSPAAKWARAAGECGPSFAWVVVPTAAVTYGTSALGGVGTAFPASITTYIATCVLVGIVAIPRRRRLNWYAAGCCSSCGYDVRGLEGPRCPECGKVARVRPRVRVLANLLRD